jgi:hypothetical protein
MGPIFLTGDRPATSRSPECPLLALSGHSASARPCPLLGVKRTSNRQASMSAYDPKRTFAAAASRSRKLIKEEINGSNLAVSGDDEIGSGVSRRLGRAARHPTNPPRIAHHFRRGERLISGRSRRDRGKCRWARGIRHLRGKSRRSLCVDARDQSLRTRHGGYEATRSIQCRTWF